MFDIYSFLFSLPSIPSTLFSFVHDYDDCKYLCGCDFLSDI